MEESGAAGAAVVSRSGLGNGTAGVKSSWRIIDPRAGGFRAWKEAELLGSLVGLGARVRDARVGDFDMDWRDACNKDFLRER